MSGEDVKAIHDKLDALIISQATLSTKFDASCKRLDDVCGDVWGNGKNGLKADLAEHLTRHDERGKVFKMLAALGSGTGISALATAIAALIGK